MILNKPFLLSVLLLSGIGLTGCGGSSSNSDPDPQPPVADADSDGVLDASDNCPMDANADQLDSDDDGTGDVCDATPLPPTSDDTDSDGILNAVDNCPSMANVNQVDSDLDGAGDVCDPIPTSYAFTDAADADTVSYTGQTKRHIFMEDLVDTMESLVEGGVPNAGSVEPDVVAALNFFFRFDGSTSDDIEASFSLGDVSLEPNNGTVLTYGSISSGKNLVGKIAGGDGAGGGETSRLIDGEFFGWDTGLEADPIPVEFVDYLFTQLENEATDNVTPGIAVTGGTDILSNVTVSAEGVDYRQLIQKFLGGALSFSQGTNDYFQTDFANSLSLEDGKAYTSAEHDWDEAFGYFGAARNYADYSDDEIAAKGGRVEFENGYNDANGDGLIDIRSEVNLGHSTNCAKRDRGTVNNTNPTNYTQEAFDAFLLGREILKNAAAAGELTAEAQTALDAQIEIASTVWEKCIAATVVHYINDVVDDLDEYDADNGVFANIDNFLNVAKHWSEMKGFALALQFSPASPFRVDINTLADLRLVLRLMGDAPVLADGTQHTADFEGGVAAYRADLLMARDLLETAYSFDSENVINW